MKKPGKSELLQAAVFLLCLVVAWINLDYFGAPDGGRITGPIYSLCDDGWVVFSLAVLLTFFVSRVAAALALAATLLCLPLYLYVLAPGPVRFIFPGPWKSPLRAVFVWDSWAITGIFSLAAAVFVIVRCFSATHLRRNPARTDNL
jgi:hypothetical protein